MANVPFVVILYNLLWRDFGRTGTRERMILSKQRERNASCSLSRIEKKNRKKEKEKEEIRDDMDGKKRRFPTFSVAFLSLLSDIARSLERFDRPRPCYSLDNRKQRNRNRESINSSVVGVWKRSSIEWWLRCLRGDMKEYEDWENEGKLNRWRIVCSCGECNRQWTTSNNNVYTIHKYMDAYEKWINLRIHKWDRLIKKKKRSLWYHCHHCFILSFWYHMLFQVSFFA